MNPSKRLALSLAVDDECDCGEVDADGFMPAILALPTVVQAPPYDFFATSVAERTAAGKWTVARAREVLERTGGVLRMPPSGLPS